MLPLQHEPLFFVGLVMKTGLVMKILPVMMMQCGAPPTGAAVLLTPAAVVRFRHRRLVSVLLPRPFQMATSPLSLARMLDAVETWLKRPGRGHGLLCQMILLANLCVVLHPDEAAIAHCYFLQQKQRVLISLFSNLVLDWKRLISRP